MSRYEVVFLPYKASMWDSMESIYLEAQKDKNCKCYVVPVPYYELSNGGNIKRIVYEGDKFPSYIPITDFRKYNIKERKPDVIYVHNPYDNYNLITRVYSDYFSFNLKKYSNMLVYVPYFVTSGKLPKELYYLPAYNNVDRIIAQSHNQVDCYDKSIPREKILVYGSPKIDKLVNYNEELIPDSWKERIKDKKVFFYNISISKLLQDGISLMEKMLKIFIIFYKRKDIVLLWRPHPLLDITLSTLRPDYVEVYNSVVDWFKKNNVGIYDESDDISRAVSISDAYIGEENSSVVHMFGVLGKPVYIINNRINIEDNINYNLKFFDFCMADKNMYFMSGDFSCLCNYNIFNKQLQLKCITDNEKFDQERLYGDMIKIDNKIVAAPMNSNKIFIYDIISNKESYINLDNSQFSNFNRLIKIDDNIYFIPTYYQGIIKYNVKNNKYEILNKWVEEFNRLSDNKEGFFTMFAAIAIDKSICIASAKSNIIMEYNTLSNTYEFYRVGDKDENYWDMAYDGESCWLIPNDGKQIIKWNYNTKKIIKINNYPNEFNRVNNAFLRIIKCGKYMVLIPKLGNYILKIDINNNKISKVPVALGYNEGERKSSIYKWSSNYVMAKECDDTHIYAVTSFDNSLLKINVISGEFEKVEIRLNEEKKMEVIKCLGEKKNDNLPYAYLENGLCSINDFIDFVVQGKHDSEKEKEIYKKIATNINGTCGKKIHERIMKELETYSKGK